MCNVKIHKRILKVLLENVSIFGVIMDIMTKHCIYRYQSYGDTRTVYAYV